jgi:hypothetical protein
MNVLKQSAGGIWDGKDFRPKSHEIATTKFIFFDREIQVVAIDLRRMTALISPLSFTD